MKPKEIIQLVVALVIFAIAGVVIYLQVGPKSGGQQAQQAPTITVVTMVEPGYNQEALQKITDSSKIRDYYQAPDLKSGLGNTQPFAPLR